MPASTYRLQPVSGFHLGREGLAQETSAETFPSDSLFSALVTTLAQLRPASELNDFLDGFGVAENEAVVPPLRLSSLFPYVGDVLLFPLPRRRIVFHTHDAFRAKQLKKLKYVSSGILTRLLLGDPMDDWLPSAHMPDAGHNGLLLQGGRVWLSADEQVQLPPTWKNLQREQLVEQSIWHNGTVPRVTVDRVNNSSVIYQMGRTVFAPGCGLWLQAQTQDQATADLLDEVLLHLGDIGIGGERSSGYGAFTPERLSGFTLPGVKHGPYTLLLSRYSPTLDELEAGILTDLDASYELVDVGGWLNAPGVASQRRKRVRLIEAGSVLRAQPEQLTGRLLDVTPEYNQLGAPDHSVYRSGLALGIGAAKLPEDKQVGT